MEEDNQVLESDAQPEASSEPQSAPEGSESQESKDSEGSGEVKQQDTTPFHEHPRFKELVEQKNKSFEYAKALEARYAQLENRFKQIEDSRMSKKEEDALISRLKGIDPEFGARFEKLDATTRELEDLRQWRAQEEQRRAVTDIVGVINHLHTENKITPELAARYNRELDLAYTQGHIKNQEDARRVYKQVHDEYSKFLDNVRRSERETYVTGKKTDAKIPSSQPRGKAVTPGKESNFSKDPAEARAQLVSRVLKMTKADKDI